MLPVFHLRLCWELMHLHCLIHPIPKRERGEAEPWTILAVTRFCAFKSNFFAGRRFSEKLAVKWQFKITLHWCSRVSCSEEWSYSCPWNYSGCGVVVLFFFVVVVVVFAYLFVFVFVGSRRGKQGDLKFRRSPRDRGSSGREIFDCWAQGSQDMETFWKIWACSNHIILDTLTRRYICGCIEDIFFPVNFAI